MSSSEGAGPCVLGGCCKRAEVSLFLDKRLNTAAQWRVSISDNLSDDRWSTFWPKHTGMQVEQGKVRSIGSVVGGLQLHSGSGLHAGGNPRQLPLGGWLVTGLLPVRFRELLADECRLLVVQNLRTGESIAESGVLVELPDDFLV